MSVFLAFGSMLPLIIFVVVLLLISAALVAARAGTTTPVRFVYGGWRGEMRLIDRAIRRAVCWTVPIVIVALVAQP